MVEEVQSHRVHMGRDSNQSFALVVKDACKQAVRSTLYTVVVYELLLCTWIFEVSCPSCTPCCHVQGT